MKETILEMLKGLGEAKEAREKKLADLANCDDTAIIEEKKAELQKEMDEKLAEFVNGINGEREKSKAKLNRDLETIDELIAENNDKLAEIVEAEKVEAENVESGEGTAEVQGNEPVQETIPDVPTGAFNPFRP